MIKLRSRPDMPRWLSRGLRTGGGGDRHGHAELPASARLSCSPPPAGAFGRCAGLSDRADFLGLRALGALRGGELDPLVLLRLR